MATPQSDVALDLLTEHKRPTIKIDHVPYELRTLNDFNFYEYHELDRVGPQIGRLIQQLEAKTLTPDGDAELAGLLKQACASALHAPEGVLAKLHRFQQLAVYKVFRERLQQELLLTSAMMQPAGTGSNGTKPSPGLSASTAVMPGAGSASRSGRSRRSSRKSRS